MKVDQLQKAVPEPRQRGQVREGFRYVRSRRILWAPLLVVAVVSCFAWELEVVLPVMARFTFEVNAGGYGLMFAALGAGAVIGSLAFASSRGRTVSSIGRAAMLLGGAMLATSLGTLLPVGVGRPRPRRRDWCRAVLTHLLTPPTNAQARDARTSPRPSFDRLPRDPTARSTVDGVDRRTWGSTSGPRGRCCSMSRSGLVGAFGARPKTLSRESDRLMQRSMVPMSAARGSCSARHLHFN